MSYYISSHRCFRIEVVTEWHNDCFLDAAILLQTGGTGDDWIVVGLLISIGMMIAPLIIDMGVAVISGLLRAMPCLALFGGVMILVWSLPAIGGAMVEIVRPMVRPFRVILFVPIAIWLLRLLVWQWRGIKAWIGQVGLLMFGSSPPAS